MRIGIATQPIGPVSVAARAFRRGGATFLTAIVKAAYRVVDGRPMVASDPPQIVGREIKRNAGALASIRQPSDLALAVPRPEIFLDAVAHAGRRGPVEHMTVELGVERDGRALLRKELTVLGDRTVVPGTPPGRPLPFERMPIIYERALGGAGHARNPVGVGTSDEGGGRITMPNVAFGRGASAEPAGFAPISSAWAARAAKRGALRVVDAEHAPYAELPAGFDDSYFQAAPDDQRLESLHPGDVVILVGLHPELPMIRAAIPARRAIASVDTNARTNARVELRLDTLFVDTTSLRAELTFRGSIAVRPEELAAVRVTGALDEVRSSLAPPPFAPSNAERAGRSLADEKTVSLETPLRTGTMLIEPDAPIAEASSERGPRRGGTMVLEAGAASSPSPRSIEIEDELTTTFADDETADLTEDDAPRPRRATLELSRDDAPISLPFARSARARSSGEGEVVRTATPWSPEDLPDAPEARSAGHATMIIDSALASGLGDAAAPGGAAEASRAEASRAEASRADVAPAPPSAARATDARPLTRSATWARVDPDPSLEPRPAPPRRPVVRATADRKVDLYTTFKQR
jgi:hypothetical protein